MRSEGAVDGIRARFQQDRARLVSRHHQEAGGGTMVRAYGRLVDATLRTLADELLPNDAGLALVAVGGYGRGELAFESDLDLHLFHPGPEPPAGARSFIQSLWDLGPRIGHQVVTPDQGLALAGSDPKTLTAYLELRPLWGETGLVDGFDQRLRREVLGPRQDDFRDYKVAELERRHREAGDTVYLSEPDVKESPGGLRDLHTLLWLSNAAGGPHGWSDYLTEHSAAGEDWQRLQGAWDLLWRVRNTLHLLKGRPWDRLDHASQQRLADDLGFPARRGRLPVEVFMREYYQAAWEVYAFTRLQLVRSGIELKGGGPAALAVVAAGEGAVRWSPEDLEEVPLAVVNGFRKLALDRGRLAGETADYLHRHGRRLGAAARAHPGHGRLLLDLLASPHAAWSLHAMHQLGVLGGLLPEFARLTALVQFDPYHHYTVDEHTLRMLDALEDLLADPTPMAPAVRHLPADRWRPEAHDLGILRLAILFHDIAKGTGTGRHAERGARMMRTAARRLGLDRLSTDDAVFLVRHHLLLSEAAQRRDVREEALLRRLQRVVRTPRCLRLLALLTLCDQAALGPGSLTPWKVRLLVDLVDRLEGFMAGRPAPGPEAERARALREVPAERREEAAAFLAAMPPHYLRDLDPERIVADRDLVAAWQAGDAPDRVVLDFDHRPEGTVLSVVTRDRAELLARLCGLLAALDVTILHARISTRLDGVVLDRFLVADAGAGGRAGGAPGARSGPEPEPGNRPMSAEQCAEVARRVEDALAGRLDVEGMLQAHRARFRLRDRPRMEHAVRVTFDPVASDRYTVVEIRAGDHVGLLHDVTRAMADLGAAIHQAFVTTEGERAVDAFYVTDPLGAPLDEGTRRLLAERLREVLEG